MRARARGISFVVVVATMNDTRLEDFPIHRADYRRRGAI